MLTITVKAGELFNEDTCEFITNNNDTEITLEHSLISISKWESKHHKPFMSKNQKSNEELLDYVRCMTLTKNVDDSVYKLITQAQLKEIVAYIDDPMSATTFSNLGPQKRSNEIVTSELIYYWMVALQIPYQFEKWHLNRLLNLIKICNIKNTPPKKMSKQALANNNAALNAQRRAKLGSKG